MTSASTIIKELLERGVLLWAEGENIRYRGPVSAVTPRYLQAVKEHKPAILSQLHEAGATDETLSIADVMRRVGLAPLSYSQRQIWLSEVARSEPRTSAYSLPVPLHIEGRLVVAAFSDAVDALVARHEALRTRIRLIDGQPVQYVMGASHGRTLTIATPANVGASTPEEWLNLRAAHQFDVYGELFRIELFSYTETSHFLMMSMHHIIGDAWSLANLVSDLCSLYESKISGVQSPLQPQTYHIIDHCAWELSNSSPESWDAHRQYWAARLKNCPALTTLPTDFPRPSRRSQAGAVVDAYLTSVEADALRLLAGQCGSTTYLIGLCVYAIVLSRLSGQSELVIGSITAGRPNHDAHSAVGCFVNTIALDVQVSEECTFKDFVAAVTERLLDAYENEALPFDEVLRCVAPTTMPGAHPLFQCCFVSNVVASETYSASELQLKPVEIDSGSAKFDLNLLLTDAPRGFKFRAEYATDLFTEQTIAAFVGGLRSVLVQAAADPSVATKHLALASPPSTGRQRSGLEPAPNAGDRTVTARFAAQVSRVPDRIAVTCEDRSLTYAELGRRAERLAHVLTRLGVSRGSIIAIALPRSIELIIGMIATLQCGAAYVPIDTDNITERTKRILQDCAPRLVLTTQVISQALDATPNILCIDDPAIVQELDMWPAGDEATPTGATAAETAYIIYTSGSTGHPKGVMVSHLNVVRLLDVTKSWLQASERDVWSLFHSPGFDFSVWEIWGALLSGGRLAIVPYRQTRSPDRFLAFLETQSITILNQTPSAFYQLLSALEFQKADIALPELRFIIFGGEALDISRLMAWYRRFPGTQTRLVNMYGITETTVHSTALMIDEQLASTSVGNRIGKALDDVAVYILDACLQPLPPGAVGEICVGGAGVAQCYLGRPALTAERFVPDPFAPPGHRMYRSGDIGRYLEDGSLEYMGRRDSQVKIRGFRIELGEIEACLAKHPAIKSIAVTIESPNADDAKLVAWVVPLDRSSFEAGDVKTFAAQQLPSYMQPADIRTIATIPLTLNGKLDRSALERSARQTPRRKTVSPPRVGSKEAILSKIWEDVLHTPEIDPDDNFLALGGNSMSAVRIVQQARLQGIMLSVEALFDQPTLRALADASDNSSGHPITVRRNDDGSRERAQRTGPNLTDEIVDLYDLSSMQQLMAEEYANYAATGIGVYHVQQVYRLRDEHASLSAMQAALDAVVAQHATLRTVVVAAADGRLAQAKRAHLPIPLHLHDLRGLSESAQTEHVQEIVARDLATPFRYDERSPLFRSRWIAISDCECLLFMSAHHLIEDGWGNQRFLAELLEAYKRSKSGEPVLRYARPDVQKELVTLERAAALNADPSGYWTLLQHLKTPALNSRSDRHSPPSAGAHIDGLVNRTTLAALRGLARKHKVSLKAILLHAFSSSILNFTRESVVVGIVCNGRSAALSDAFGALGMFWSMVPVALRSLHMSFADVLTTAQASLNLAERNALFPFSGIRDRRDFDSKIVASFNFIDFPQSEKTAEVWTESQIELVSSLDRFHYPLNFAFAANPVDQTMGIRCDYDGRTFNAAAAAAIHGSVLDMINSSLGRGDAFHPHVNTAGASDNLSI